MVCGSTVRTSPTSSRLALTVNTRSRPSRVSAVSATLGAKGSTAMREADGTIFGPRRWNASHPHAAPMLAPLPRWAWPTGNAGMLSDLASRGQGRRGQRPMNSSALANRSAGALARAVVIASSIASGTASRSPGSRDRVHGMPRHDRPRRGPAERWLARQHLVEHTGQPIDVTPGIHSVPDRSAQDSCRPGFPSPARLREPRIAGDLDGLGDAEVSHQRVRTRDRMFSGLISRWTTPFRCASPRASATSPAIWSASSTGNAPSRVSRCRSDSPETYGIT